MALQPVREQARCNGGSAIADKLYYIPWRYIFDNLNSVSSFDPSDNSLDLNSVSFFDPSDNSLFKKWAFHSSSMSDTERMLYEDRAINFDLRNNCLLMVISDEFSNKLAAYARFKGHVRYILFREDRLNYLLILNFKIIHFINHVSFFKVTRIDKKLWDRLNELNKLAFNGSYSLLTIFVSLRFKWFFIKYLFNQDFRYFLREIADGARYESNNVNHPYPYVDDGVNPFYYEGHYRVPGPAAPDIRYYQSLCSKYYLLSLITKSAVIPLYNMLKDNDYDANGLNSCLRGIIKCAYPSEICKIICHASTSSVWLADDVLYDAIKEACGVSMPLAIITMLMEYSDMDEKVIMVQNKGGKEIVLFGL